MKVKKDDRILLTGGTGFLGSYILEELLHKGFTNIHVLSRNKIDSSLYQLRYLQGDVLDVFRLDDLIQNIDCVIHAAAIVSFEKKDRREMFAVNVEGTANLVNVSLDHGVRRFIHVSSTAAIGKNLDDSEITENTKWSDKLTHTQYALSKFLSEKHVWRAHAEGLQVSVVNPALILGKGDWKSGTSGFFSKIDKGLKYYPIGSNGIVAASDVARFVTELLFQEDFGERYILSSENMTYKTLFQQIASQLSVKAPYIPIEGKYRLLALLKERVSRVTGSKTNYLTKESLKNISEKKRYSNSKSLSKFDFQYQSIPSLLNQISAEYLQNS